MATFLPAGRTWLCTKTLQPYPQGVEPRVVSSPEKFARATGDCGAADATQTNAALTTIEPASNASHCCRRSLNRHPA